MWTVDDHQFELRYAPLACGLQFLVVGCAAAAILTTIWYFVTRGG